MLPSELRILRVFGVPAAEVSEVLRAARADGCPNLRLLERNGEFAVCVQVSAPTQSMAEEYCGKWVQKLRARFGDAVYGTGETSLAQVTLNTMLQKRRLFVAADEPTGGLLGTLLRPLNHSEAAFDFGTQTYANPAAAKKIITPESVLARFPGDVVQAAAARAQLALAAGGADYAAVYMPATVGQAPFVLVCDKRSAVALAVAPDMADATIANCMLDLLRRRALGQHMPAAAIVFRPGHERPMLLYSQEGKSAVERSNTGRFSLRRRAPAKPSAPAAENEPTLTELAGVNDAAAKIEKATALPHLPQDDDGTIPYVIPKKEKTQAVTGEPVSDLPNMADLSSFMAGGMAAAEPRARHNNTGNTRTLRQNGTAPKIIPEPKTEPKSKPEETHKQDMTQEQQQSILDADIPDFAAALDPDTIAAANAADEKAGPRSADELVRAANQLFGDAENAQAKSAPKQRKAKKAETPPAAPTLHSRSLAMIERNERRRHRHMVITGILVLLVLLAGAAGLYWFFRNDLGVAPQAKNYGTASYDAMAEEYLGNATAKLSGVWGYIGFPGTEGRFVYAAAAATPATQESAAPVVVLATASGLGTAAPTNTVIECGGTALLGMAQLETVRANSGFTLYLPGSSYRYKVMAVYYADGMQTENAFDPADFTDLSDYYDYLDFVLGAGMRSLYETAVQTGDKASFLTLVSDSDTPGVRICVTGRLLGESENGELSPQNITQAEAPLLTAAQYAATGAQQPDTLALLAQRMALFNADTTAQRQQAATASSFQSAENSDLSNTIIAISQQTQDLLDSTDAMMEGLTDIAGSADAAETDIKQGAEGTLPEQTITVEDLISAAKPTSAPTAAPTEAPTEAPAAPPAAETPAGSDTAQTPTDAPTAAPTEAPTAAPTEAPPAQTETINVNMNGTNQTLDLVQCLAMIAQNELGSNAPAEAYKAQCVAAHCWIISQGGYPAVLGATPGSAALAAAQEVAHVLVTYNGNVCFTPYFASASTGTASSAEVWGNDRPWLQAVESPYDQTVGTNWNTNGNNTGCARFARQTLQDRILAEMGVDLSGVDPNSWFTILSTNQYGWVAQMQIGPNASGNDTCSGRWFRENLLARQSVDGRSLRSQCFTVTYNAELDCFIFDVYGYGHGCGMSQWGAIGYAQNGWDYASILMHYYTGTTLTTY